MNGKDMDGSDCGLIVLFSLLPGVGAVEDLVKPQDIWHREQDANHTPPEYKSRTLLL